MSDTIDPDDYEIPKRVKSEKRKRGVVVSVRLSIPEMEAIEAIARERGMLISTYLREAGLAPTPPVLNLPAMSATLTLSFQPMSVDCVNR